jgi:hypothetical protein
MNHLKQKPHYLQETHFQLIFFYHKFDVADLSFEPGSPPFEVRYFCLYTKTFSSISWWLSKSLERYNEHSIHAAHKKVNTKHKTSFMRETIHLSDEH